MSKIKLFVASILILVISLLLLTDFDQIVVSLINQNIESLKLYKNNNPFILELNFFLIYIVVASLSIPLAAILGILSGMIFDTLDGIIIVSFASSIGATFSFLISRYLFREYIKTKFNQEYEKINDGFIKYSGYYLFALRMCFIFPFFIVNLVLGLTTIKTPLYYIVSQIGMLPATIIIVNLGGSISRSLSSNVNISFEILILLTLLGFLPLISRFLLKKFLI